MAKSPGYATGSTGSASAAGRRGERRCLIPEPDPAVLTWGKSEAAAEDPRKMGRVKETSATSDFSNRHSREDARLEHSRCNFYPGIHQFLAEGFPVAGQDPVHGPWRNAQCAGDIAGSELQL